MGIPEGDLRAKHGATSEAEAPFFVDSIEFSFCVLYKNRFSHDSDNSHVDKVLAFSHTSGKYLNLGAPSFNCRGI